ncbi:MAG: AAA family ATPase [Candidatus Aenigmarchaeota archaeon]|nr:AAA family ATPase [Candidatus Aenigmarchaeota archaeon]
MESLNISDTNVLTDLKPIQRESNKPSSHEKIIPINGEDPSFSIKQRDAFRLYKEGLNMFITGPGGCGKTYLIKKIMDDAKSYSMNVALTALTGCAAILLGPTATTLHSWGSIGLGDDDVEKYITTFQQKPFWAKNFLTTDLLIIDEISMANPIYLDKLEQIARVLRKSDKPFGGIQVILSGDFFQLPPVSKNRPTVYCFEHEIWDRVVECEIELDFIFRQKNIKFQEMLSHIRRGFLEKDDLKLLAGVHGKKPHTESGVIPTKIYSLTKRVMELNLTELNILKTKVETFKLKESKTCNPGEITALRQLKNNGIFVEKLQLKIGAQVMCIANINLEDGICNGSRGVVIDFQSGFPVVKFVNDKELVMLPHVWEYKNSAKKINVNITQIPLILAWAVTIHKIQGATLDFAEISIDGGIFECGQTYVALSRLTTLDGLYLRSFDANKIMANDRVIEFYKKFDKEVHIAER